MATKKQAILDTALDLFVKNGIDATSIRQIASGADTAEGNIYRHFKSKNDLARKLFLSCADQFRQALKNALNDTNASDSPKARLDVLVREIFEFSIRHKREFTYILVANHREEIIDEEILSKPLPKDVFVEILEDGIEEGTFRSVEPNITVAWIVGMVQRGFTFLQRGMTPLSEKEVIDETANAALRMLEAR